MITTTEEIFDIDSAIAKQKQQIKEIDLDQYVGKNGGKTSPQYKKALRQVKTLQETIEILESTRSMPEGCYVSHPQYGIGVVKKHKLDDRGVPMTLTEFDEDGKQAVPTRELKATEPVVVADIKTQVLDTLTTEWQSDIAIARALKLPLVEVKRQLEELQQEKKAVVASEGMRWKQQPQQEIPTCGIFFSERRTLAYELPKIWMATVTTTTPSLVELQLDDSSHKKMIPKDQARCLTLSDWRQAVELHAKFQSTLKELGDAIASFDRYDTKLNQLGYEAAPNPLGEEVLIAPSKEDSYIIDNAWEVPHMQFLQVLRHTPQKMRVVRDGKELLIDQSRGFCLNKESQERISNLRDAAILASEKFEVFLGGLEVYSLKEGNKKDKESYEFYPSSPREEKGLTLSVANKYSTEAWLNPDDIIIDAGTQSRISEDQEKIDDYKRDMDGGEWDYERRPLPVVALFEGQYYAVDCHHRVRAGRSSVNCAKMLFDVHQIALAQARLWSTSANTQHGLGADNSPSGVRKRIEMFLDNVELLTPEQYREEFEKVPDLTPAERKLGKFSDRTIAKYLRLRSGQSRTVSNIRKERETAEQISQLDLVEGSRIEVIKEGSERPTGSLGTVMQLDRKSGVWVRWDSDDGRVWAIPPEFLVKTTKAKDVASAPTTKNQEQPLSPATTETAARLFEPPGEEDAVFPDLTPDTPDKGSPETIMPLDEQFTTTLEHYEQAEAEIAVEDAAIALAKMSPNQLSEVVCKLLELGLSEQHFSAIAASAHNILNSAFTVAV